MGSRSTAASATRRVALSSPTEPSLLAFQAPARAGAFFVIVPSFVTVNAPPATSGTGGASLLDLVGKTPLVELKHFSRGAARILAKLEWLNPGGSV